MLWTAQRIMTEQSDSFEFIVCECVIVTIVSSLVLWEIAGPSSSWAGDIWTSETAPILIALHSGNMLSVLVLRMINYLLI